MLLFGRKCGGHVHSSSPSTLIFITFLLSSQDYIFTATTAAAVPNETITEIIDVHTLYVSKLNNQTLFDCTTYVNTMIGPLPPQEDEPDLTGIYTRFVQAYHYAFPAITWWPEAHDEFHQSRHVFVHAREMQKGWEFLRACEITLRQFYIYIYHPDGAVKDHPSIYLAKENTIRELCIDNEDIPPRVIDKMDESILTSCFETMALVLTSFWGAGKDKKISESFEAPFHTSLFGRIHMETTDADVDIHKRLTDTFPKYIDKVRLDNPRDADMLQDRLDEIKTKLMTPPFDKIYLNGDITALEDRESNFNGDGWDDFTENLNYLYKEYNSIDQSSTLEENIEYWREDLQGFMEDINNGKFQEYFDAVVKFYDDWLKVDLINVNNLTAESLVLLEYGEIWDWDTSLKIQGMRAAWNLVGAVLEEIKCYMKETYFYDLRDEALRRTQRDLTNGSLYYGTSYTIFLPCRKFK